MKNRFLDGFASVLLCGAVALQARGDVGADDFRRRADERIASIRATPNRTVPAGAPCFYVSARNGDDAADGRSPSAPWRTLARLKEADTPPGSYVLLERGGVYRGSIRARSRVTYTAYGTGAKPVLCTSPEDGANPSKWRQTENPKVWAYDIGRQDVGTLVFDGGKAHAIKVLIRTDAKTGRKSDQRTGKPFASYRDLCRDLDFWHDYYENGTGLLYLCSETNPGERFKAIEFCVKRNAISVGATPDVTVDNLCIKYVGAHGVGAGTCRNLTVANCEFAWIGGSIQGEAMFGRDHPTRYGNGVEVYGGCDGFVVTNCIFREIYDAAVTQQYNIRPCDGMKRFDQRHVRYVGNVIDRCNYSVEYFLSAPNGNQSRMEDILVADNLMFDAGFGYCEQRPDRGGAAHVKGWWRKDRNRAHGFVLRDNVMCRSRDSFLNVGCALRNADGSSSLPRIAGNVLVASAGSSFGYVSEKSPVQLPFGAEAQAILDRQGPGNRLVMPLDWDFSLLLGDAKVPRQCKLEVRGADMMRREVRETDTGTTIVWTGHPTAGADFKVTARLRPDGKGGWSYGFDYAGNVRGLAVEEIGFPVITVPRTDRTEVLYPRQTGMLRRPDWTKYKSGETVQAFGPNTVGFHFAATIDAQAGGWYVDQRGDARKRPARFSFTAAPSNRVTIAVTTYPSVHLDRAASGALPFEGTIRPFRGDWFAAASIYRDWLKTQDWYVKARSRDFGKLRDVALWMWNRGRSHEVMPSVERFVDETGLPAALDWYWWHEIPYDTEYPFFWPPREGERAFADAVARLHRRGVYVQTYTNGMLWDMDRPDWNEGGSEGQMLYRSGGPNMTVFNVYLNHRMAIMCGEAPVFQARLREVERKLAATGLDALYLDMIGNCMAACWNPKHRHAPGGGTVMADGYRQLLADVRADNPGVHLSSEEEGEAYVDALDSLIVLYAASERLGKGVAPEHEMLPVFPMLYHGCVALYGSYSVIDGITPWDEKWGARPAIDEARWAGKFPDQFALEFARGVTWGIQPTVHKLLPEHQTDAKWAAEWKFVKDTAAFYHANRDFLFDGEMQSPGAMTCPRRPVDFFIRGCYTKEENFRTARQEAVPTVLHSVWRTRDGGTAAVLVNWTREEQPYRLVTSSGTAEGHLPARSWKLLRQGGVN